MPIPDHYRPIYKLTIKNPGGTEFEYNSWYFKNATGQKKKQNNKLAIYIDRDLGTKLDICMISISLRSGDLVSTASSLKVGDIKIGAEVNVYLGYAVEDEDRISLTPADIAFTGIVDEVSQSFKNISITAYSMAYKIIFKKAESTKFDNPTEKAKEKTSKQLITDLLDGLLTTDSANFKDGLKFKGYTPDTSKSIYDNIRELADYNGFHFYISKDGKARFHETSSTVREFKYGEDVLDYSITISKPPYDSVEVTLNYKQDSNSKTKTITYEPISGSKTAQTKKNAEKKVEFGLADEVNTAAKVADNILKNIYVPETGQVKVIGNTRADLGDKLNIIFPRLRPGCE